MKDLSDVQDELAIARHFIECAFMACVHLEQAEPIHVVLDAASEKLKAIREAIEAIRTAPQA